MRKHNIFISSGHRTGANENLLSPFRLGQTDAAPSPNESLGFHALEPEQGRQSNSTLNTSMRGRDNKRGKRMARYCDKKEHGEAKE